MSIRACGLRLGSEPPAWRRRRHPGAVMTQYLISVYQPDGVPPPSIDLKGIMREVHALREEMQKAGVGVFSGGLHDASTAGQIWTRTLAGPYFPAVRLKT